MSREMIQGLHCPRDVLHNLARMSSVGFDSLHSLQAPDGLKTQIFAAKICGVPWNAQEDVEEVAALRALHAQDMRFCALLLLWDAHEAMPLLFKSPPDPTL